MNRLSTVGSDLYRHTLYNDFRAIPSTKGGSNMAGTKQIVLIILAVIIVAAAAILVYNHMNGDENESDPTDVLPRYTISGETDLPGNFYISFVYTKNIIMLDGKGDVVWFKHGESPEDGVNTGYWDFKKHVIDGETYYSYHDQDSQYDKFGLPGFAPGERVILDSEFNEVKRIKFERSDIVEKGHPLDGHDFLLIDLDHYIMSGYLKERVYNIPGYEETGSEVIYSYLQEVEDGEVVWDWRSIDYPETYDITATDANPDARDWDNVKGAPDYVHFNAMRLNDDGSLVCSFRHLDTILCLDRTKSLDTKDQIIWRLSGKNDEFRLTDEEKTCGQHYVTVDGDMITVFDNHNSAEATRICDFVIDDKNMVLKDFREYRIDGKFSSACGSAQHLYDDVFAIGWGCAENDTINMCVYDFATDTELLRMILENGSNFTYRCVYYD